jgi:hypothetical protein
MNPYTLIGSGLGTTEAVSLAQRLTEWHDGMVLHERRLRAGRAGHGCDEDCAHSAARTLWEEALTMFGERAHELSFLRSRAYVATGRSEDAAVPASAQESPAVDTHRPNRRTAGRPVASRLQTSLSRLSVGRNVDEKPGAEL